MICKATLAGVDLEIYGEVAFPLRVGSEPVSKIFQVTHAAASSILRRAQEQFKNRKHATYAYGDTDPDGPVTFEVKLGTSTLKVNGLYVVGPRPGADPNHVGLEVVDSRWRWRRVFVERSYNVPMATGELQIVSGDMVPLQLAQAADNLRYRANSLRNGKDRWKAREVLEDLLLMLCGKGGYSLGGLPEGEPVQGARIRDYGPQAASRVAELIPGVGFVHMPDGKVHAIPTLDRSEVALCKELEKRRWWGVGWADVDMSLARPVDTRGLFEQEIDVRFDYTAANDESGSLSTTTTRGDDRDEPIVENVIRNPEPSLTMSDGGTVTFGSWVPFGYWLDAVADLADYPAAVGALTNAKIRRWWLSGLSWLRHVYKRVPGTSDAIWSRRLSAVQECWRSHFRPPLSWRQRIRSMSAHRAAVIHYASGTRAQALCWCDHTNKPSFQALATAGDKDLGTEVTDSYSTGDLSGRTPAPFEVRIRDPQSLVFTVRPQVDVMGVSAAVAPGTLEGDLPKSSAGAAICLWNQVSLATGWRMAVIMSCVPDAPNDEGRLWTHVVKPDHPDLKKALYGLSGADLGACRGPTWAQFVGECTARFAWDDNQAAATRAAFWGDAPMPDGLLANPDEVHGAAVAHAARLYAWLTDRGMGTLTVDLDPGVIPTGNAREVVHGVTKDGAAFTRVVMPPPASPARIWALMPESSRRKIMRLLPEGSK